jgi:hypothetical protein
MKNFFFVIPNDKLHTKRKKKKQICMWECRESLSINQYLISRRQNILGEPKDPNGGKKRTQFFVTIWKSNHPTTTKGEITRPLRKAWDWSLTLKSNKGEKASNFLQVLPVFCGSRVDWCFSDRLPMIEHLFTSSSSYVLHFEWFKTLWEHFLKL